MGKISRRRLDKQLGEHISRLFWISITQLKTPKEVEAFFKDLLSPIEQLMLIKRLAIAVLLTKGYTYDRIDETLKVSRPTIMNVSFWLKNGGEGYQKVVERIMRNKKKTEIIDVVEETLLKLSLPAAVGSHRFKNKQRLGKELFNRKLLRSQF